MQTCGSKVTAEGDVSLLAQRLQAVSQTAAEEAVRAPGRRSSSTVALQGRTWQSGSRLDHCEKAEWRVMLVNCDCA